MRARDVASKSSCDPWQLEVFEAVADAATDVLSGCGKGVEEEKAA